MSERKFTLPTSSSRRQEVVYEVYPRGEGPKDSDEFKKEVTLKALESLPKMLDIAQSIVNIKATQSEAEAKVKEVREMGDFLLKQADAFVKEELARSQSTIAEAEQVQKVLADLYRFLQTSGASDEVQKTMIETVNNTLQAYLTKHRDGNLDA